MIISGTSKLINTLRRISLSLGSLLFSVTLFTLLFGLFLRSQGLFRAEPLLFILRFTMIFALPVWCLYLPFVAALKDAEERRIWTILFSGILIGPVSLALWGLILQLRGGDSHNIWQGDPLLGVLSGVAASLIYALIVGFLAASFYVMALRTLHRGGVRRRHARPRA